MNMNNETNIQKCKEIINRIYSNTDVSKLETRKDLQEIVDEIIIMLDAMGDDHE